MPTQTTLARVESFPFDSRADGYDADGYPVYDRAVGASMLRSTFAKFFSDGVFPSPGTALQISKGAGLTVTIQPGIFIINGAMGGYLTDAHSLTLDTAAPQGNVAYGIMLRYDENEQYRSCYIRVVRGDVAGTPQPPAPDQSTPGVMEYRLGYVTVPSGATDLTGATVTNEKGLAVCPYAAPFEEIDMSVVTADAMASASEALQSLLSYFETYRDTIDAALSDEEATHLQQQITAIQEQLTNTDLSGSVDNETIVYATKLPGDSTTKLRVKDGGIGTEQLADGAITRDKLTPGFSGFFPSSDPTNDNEFFVSSGDGGVWSQLRDLLDAPRTTIWSGTWTNGDLTISQNINQYGMIILSFEPSVVDINQPIIQVPMIRVKYNTSGLYKFVGTSAIYAGDGVTLGYGIAVAEFYTDSAGTTLHPSQVKDRSAKSIPVCCMGCASFATAGSVSLINTASVKLLEGVIR